MFCVLRHTFRRVSYIPVYHANAFTPPIFLSRKIHLSAIFAMLPLDAEK